MSMHNILNNKKKVTRKQYLINVLVQELIILAQKGIRVDTLIWIQRCFSYLKK